MTSAQPPCRRINLKNSDSVTAVRWSKRRNAERRREEEVHPAARTKTRRFRLPRIPRRAGRKLQGGEAGDAAENTNEAEQESNSANGFDEDDDAKSGSRAEHEALDADDAGEQSHSVEAGDAEGGDEEDDPHANPDSAHSGSPVDHAEAPTPADKSDDTPPEDDALYSGPSAQTPSNDPSYKMLLHWVRLCQTSEVCYILPPESTLAYKLPIRTGPEEDYDTITASALRMMTGSEDAEEHAARADPITSRFTRLMSDHVAWVEIEDNGRKSVVQ
eukprot:402375-Pleurochrysis_carterae.AAC.1